MGFSWSLAAIGTNSNCFFLCLLLLFRRPFKLYLNKPHFPLAQTGAGEEFNWHLPRSLFLSPDAMKSVAAVEPKFVTAIKRGEKGQKGKISRLSTLELSSPYAPQSMSTWRDGHFRVRITQESTFVEIKPEPSTTWCFPVIRGKAVYGAQRPIILQRSGHALCFPVSLARRFVERRNKGLSGERRLCLYWQSALPSLQDALAENWSPLMLFIEPCLFPSLWLTAVHLGR